MRLLAAALTTTLLASPLFARPDAPSPILTTPEAHDALSYAKPQIARVTHVDLDLTADFATHIMRGTATLDILAKQGAKEIVLDVEFHGTEVFPADQSTHAGFTATGQIRRSDFGIDFGIVAGEKLMLADKVKIELDLQFVAPSA